MKDRLKLVLLTIALLLIAVVYYVYCLTLGAVLWLFIGNKVYLEDTKLDLFMERVVYKWEDLKDKVNNE